jgi:hypothetical protein
MSALITKQRIEVLTQKLAEFDATVSQLLSQGRIPPDLLDKILAEKWEVVCELVETRKEQKLK